MNLSSLLILLQEHPEFKVFLNSLSTVSENRLVVSDAARAYFIASLSQKLNLPTLVVTAQPDDARKLFDGLQSWCPDDTSLQFYPEVDFMVRESSPAYSGAVFERLRTLSLLTEFGKNGMASNPPLIVSHASALASKTVSEMSFSKSFHTIAVGMDIDPLKLLNRWQEIGYEMEIAVEAPGTMSRRGGIVDIFPMYGEMPARLEFLGDHVESIRLFDPRTQRSSQLVSSIVITYAKEKYSSDCDNTILNYLPDNTLLILGDIDEILCVINDVSKKYSELQNTIPEPDNSTLAINPLLNSNEFEIGIGKFKQRVILYPWNPATSEEPLQSVPITPLPRYGGKLDIFIGGLKEKLRHESRVVIVSQQTQRLAEILELDSILASPAVVLNEVPPANSLTLIQGSMSEGWELPGLLTLFTDNEIFGLVKEHRVIKRRPVRHHGFTPDLVTGDYMVHIEHGIGKYSGLTTKSSEGVEREYLVLEYSAGDKLFVPTDQIDRISRYVGGAEQPPRLSRLGTQEWANTKLRIKKSVANMAEELLRVYAARESMTGFAFSSDGAWQQEMESSFPYVETTDQLAAVKAVKADMEIPKPMDRLVCGDVGYGKTEIALRAAFKAVLNNKQVALLVPTTVLAQQHIVTFQERLRAFPVKVAVLSRFTSEKEQIETIEELASGAVDICIGTHRLLQKDVLFKDLGLLIIDEEQRFGVAHKEYFKKLRQEVDILTLSATPIPRTLHMALSGIRDLSIMETPPENRLPIKTYVGAYDEHLIREAIIRELERNGQVFFIHNRIFNIHAMAEKLKFLVPEATVSVAHGRLQEELEEIMENFALHKSDVLLATTIIESGLDMPNVNTLIIDESDKLGLTQLYQLRGRVGRGGNTAYSYFLFNGGKQLTLQAKKRLKAIAEASELGAGFSIAMKDLEIRGSGNLLGAEQSGHIAAVGFDLYCKLLTEAVEEARQKRSGKPKQYEPPPKVPTISLPLIHQIPNAFISDENTRISFYKKVAAARNSADLQDISDELKDRFGEIPGAVINLLFMMTIKQLAIKADVESISSKGQQVIIQFYDLAQIDTARLSREFKGRLRIGTRQVTIDGEYFADNWQKILQRLLEIVGSQNQKEE
jgi:transcription-repair coupling factor (superfamily II helicase)